MAPIINIKYFMTRIPVILIALTVLFLTGCTTIDLSLTNEERSVIADKNINLELIDEALLRMENSKIDSMILSVDGEIILERYQNGFKREDRHDLRSATKSLTSLLIGIAIDRGFIKGTDQYIRDFFPEYITAGSEFSTITIGHLLTMTSGLDSDDWNKKSPGNEEKMYRKRSWIDFFFGLEMIYKPGEVFQYSTAGVIVLGEIIKRATGVSYQEFAGKYLFEPLGINDYLIETTRAGEADSGGHMQLKPLDFHKIARVYLDMGRYNDNVLISPQWIEASLTPRIRIDQGQDNQSLYEGYLWWLEPVIEGEVRSFQARGNGGQYLIIIPDLHMICSFTGSAYNSRKQMLPFFLVQQFIIPAVSQVASE